MDSALLYGIVTLGVGLLALIVRYCFRSKCTEIHVCYGLIDIKRDINSEIEFQEESKSPPISRQESQGI